MVGGAISANHDVSCFVFREQPVSLDVFETIVEMIDSACLEGNVCSDGPL